MKYRTPWLIVCAAIGITLLYVWELTYPDFEKRVLPCAAMLAALVLIVWFARARYDGGMKNEKRRAAIIGFVCAASSVCVSSYSGWNGGNAFISAGLTLAFIIQAWGWWKYDETNPPSAR